MMKKILLMVGVLGVAMASHAQKQFVVDPDAEMRSLGGTFNSIVVSGGIDIYLSQSENEALAVSASQERYREGLKTVVENNVLKIYYDGDKRWNNKDKQMKAYISFKNIDKIEASGACDILVAGELKGESLLLKLSGASDFKGQVELKQLHLNLSGASDVTVNGAAAEVDIESSGASDVKGFDLITDTCTAKASGASDVNITVQKEINAHASGASKIIYKGNGVLKESNSSGASKVSKRNK